MLAKAEQTAAPHADIHGYKTIADIMRSLNPFTGEFYLETLHVARYTREMYCLFGGRHTHPSTIMPGGVSADITHQTCTEYYVRLMRYIDYTKRSVPMHDDLYDFWLEALPGYDEVGYRDTNLVYWGCLRRPRLHRLRLQDDDRVGPQARTSRPGVAINGELISTDLVEINLMIRILLGSSYFEEWENERTYVTKDPLGNPVSKDHPWNKTTLPKPQKRDFTDKYSWVTSPRIYDERTDTHVAATPAAARSRASGARPRPGWWTSATSRPPASRSRWCCPRRPTWPRWSWSGRCRRSPTRSSATGRAPTTRPTRRWWGCTASRARSERSGRGARSPGRSSRCPSEAISVGFHEAARGVLSHHMVIEDGKIANYQPFPPTPWNASVRDKFGTPGPYEDSVQNTPIFEENGPENFKGVDIMRAVRSFDPCLPCGVHMYTGKGKVKKVQHTPTAMS